MEIYEVRKKKTGEIVISFSNGAGTRVLVLSPTEIIANHEAAQQSVQSDVCHTCRGNRYLGSAWMPRPCDACNSTGKRR